MKGYMTRIVSRLLVLLAVLGMVGGSTAGLVGRVAAVDLVPEKPIPSLGELLNYPHEAHITPLQGAERTAALGRLMERPETKALIAEMATKGFTFDPTKADVMRIVVQPADGALLTIEAVAMSTIANELSGALTAMLASDGTGFYQAHHTNLDPHLADVPDPPIIVNGMPYFYITTLRWVDARIIYWRYWWYDSHHHPNWYYSHYLWYWRYYYWYGVPWPWWYWWTYGWYYWRYWYFWSTWFPYYVNVPITVLEQP